MKLMLNTVLAVVFAATSPFAMADTSTGVPSGEYRAKKEQLQAECQANPERCAQVKEDLRAEAEERCRADPEKCVETKQRREEARTQVISKCQAEPEKCAEAAPQVKERRDTRQDARRGAARAKSLENTP